MSLRERVKIEQQSKSKASTFSDAEFKVLGYKLIQISTDGDLTDVSYKVRTLDGRLTPEIEASLSPHIVGPVDTVLVTNDTAESGKNVYVTTYSGPDELMAIVWHGSLRALVITDPDIKKIRWGRDVNPSWELGSENTAPAGDTALVTKAVTAGKVGYIYGFLISAQEANDFKIKWTSGGVAKSLRIVFGGLGTVESVEQVPFNEGLSADAGTNVTINNVNAGGAGKIYQVQLLYGEV